MHTICFLLWHSLMARHSQRNWNESSGCLRAYVCVCVWVSASYAFHSNQTKENHKLYESKNDSNIYAYLRFQWNDSTQLKKKERIKIYVHTALKNDWFRWIWLSSRHIFSYIGWLCINDFIHNSFLFMDFCNHFHTTLQLNGTSAWYSCNSMSFHRLSHNFYVFKH